MKSFMHSLKNAYFKTIYRQFRKTAYIFNKCLFILKGGELVDNKINSQIKCEPVRKDFSVRRVP